MMYKFSKTNAWEAVHPMEYKREKKYVSVYFFFHEKQKIFS